MLISSLGYFLWVTKTGRNIFRAEVALPLNIPERSVRLHNYNNWHFVNAEEHQDPAALERNLQLTAQRNNIAMTESWDIPNLEVKVPDRWSGITPNSIKSLNPNAKVYRIYDLISKSNWEADFPKISGQTTTATAVTLTDANANWVVQSSWPNQWAGRFVWVRNGSAKDQVRKIKSYSYDTVTGSTLVIETPWSGSPPETGADYVFVDTIDPIGANDPWAFIQTPLTWAEIENNGWWLLDGDSQKVDEAGSSNPKTIWYLDVGALGFKEKFTQDLLARMQNDRLKSVIPNYGDFDGIVFDYWYTGISYFFVNRQDYNENPLPNLKFPTKYAPKGTETAAEVDQNWFDNAWKPFIEYVMPAVSAAGFKIIGNSVGEYNPDFIGQPLTDWRARLQWQRKFVDGTVYEQGAVGWKGEWLSGQTILNRITAIADDPLETWVADLGVQDSWPEYERKKNLSLAMYYTAVPAEQTRYSYDHEKDRLPFIDPQWDFNIGVPIETGVRVDVDGVAKYAWSRKFSDGLVLLNYGETAASNESIEFDLDKNYVDFAGNKYIKTVSLPAHTGLILKTGAVIPSLITIELQGRTNFTSSASLKIFPAGSPTSVFEKNDLSFDENGSSQANLPDLAAGNYDLQIKFPYYLSARLTNIPLANFGNLNFGTLKGGDLLVDNQINGGDFTYLKQKFRISDPVDPVADIDQSGEVNTLDFSVIYANWGLNGQ